MPLGMAMVSFRWTEITSLSGMMSLFCTLKIQDLLFLFENGFQCLSWQIQGMVLSTFDLVCL